MTTEVCPVCHGTTTLVRSDGTRPCPFCCRSDYTGEDGCALGFFAILVFAVILIVCALVG